MGKEGLIYFKDGLLLAESGGVCVYKMNNSLFLEKGPGHTLWASSNEFGDYIQQLGSFPNGDCLEIGLGLGIVSRYLLSFPRVKFLTTVEIDKDVIAVQKKVNYIDDNRHTILNTNGLHYSYLTKKRFDFIFLDFYTIIDEDTLPQIADMVVACKKILNRNGKIMGWLDKYTPGDFALEFMNFFN